MSKILGISTTTAAAIMLGLAFCAVVSFEAEAGGGKPHQNLSGPPACATLQSGTPGYRDCIASYGPSKSKIITADTQLKSQPNSSSQAVGILNKGTKVALIERTANGFWCHVQSGGFDGYVPFEVLD